MWFDAIETNDGYPITSISPTLMPKDRKTCGLIADAIILQCIVVCAGATSILGCFWTPNHSMQDFSKLARIMYLYDFEACGYKLSVAKRIANLILSNDTFGLNVLPIKCSPVAHFVATRLSAVTREYILLSVILHVLWIILSVTFRVIMKNSSGVHLLKATVTTFYYVCVFMICFDLSMAAVYVTNIKQSLSKGMILRYSGWSTVLKLTDYDDFAGWLPIVAAACWLRGVVIFMLNMYFCKLIGVTKKKITKREFIMRKVYNKKYQPFPEAQQIQIADSKILLYRVGESEPQYKYVAFD